MRRSDVVRRFVVLGCTAALVGGALGLSTAGASAPAAKPTRGGSFTYLFLGAPPPTFDPAQGQGAIRRTAGQYESAVFGFLLYEDYKKGKVVGQMAESMTATDPTHWVLKVRKGIEFTDKTPYDAAAVKFNWERVAAEPTAPSQGAAKQIASMTVTDPLTLNIELVAPNVTFDQTVAENLTFIGSPKALQEHPEGFLKSPVGAGPFILESYGADQTAVYQRNPDYWDQPRPYLDQLTIKSIIDDGQRYNTFTSGGGNLADLGPVSIDTAKSAGDKLTQLAPSPGGGFTFIFNTTAAPFNEKSARLGLLAAFDFDKYAEAIWNDKLVATPAFFQKSSPFYTPKAKFPKHDPKRAQKAFDEYAAKTGQPAHINLRFSQAGSISEAVTSYFTALFSTYRNVVFEANTLAASEYGTVLTGRDFGAIVYAWSGADPAVLADFYKTDGAKNYGKYSNPRADQLFDELGGTTDQAKRAKIFAQIADILTNQDEISNLVGQNQIFVVSTKDVRRLDQYAINGLWLWDQMSLTKS